MLDCTQVFAHKNPAASPSTHRHTPSNPVPLFCLLPLCGTNGLLNALVTQMLHWPTGRVASPPHWGEKWMLPRVSGAEVTKLFFPLKHRRRKIESLSLQAAGRLTKGVLLFNARRWEGLPRAGSYRFFAIRIKL